MQENKKENRKEIVGSIVYNFLSKLIGFLTTLVVSIKIGTSIQLDLYYLVFGLIGAICGLIVTQESYHITPRGLLIKSKLGIDSFVKYYNNILVIYGLIALILGAIFISLTTPIVNAVSKYPLEYIKKTEGLLRYLTIYLCLTPINTLLGNILNSLNYYRVTTIITFLSSIVIVLCLITLEFKDTTALFLSTGISSVGTLIAFVTFLKVKGWNFNFGISMPKLKPSYKLLYANGMAFLAYFKGMLNNYLVSGLNKGALTGFTYGYGLHNMPSFLILSQIKIPYSVKISELFHEKKLFELSSYISRILLVLIHLTIPINLIFFEYSKEIVYLIYGNGKFDSTTISSISDVFGNLSFTIPLSVFESFIFQIFISLNKLKEISKYTLWNNLLLLVLNFVGISYFGLKGFAVSMILMYFFMVVYLVYHLRKTFNFIKLKMAFIQYLTLLAFSYLLMEITQFVLKNLNFENQITLLIVNILSYFFFYAIMVYYLNLGNVPRSEFASFYRKQILKK